MNWAGCYAVIWICIISRWKSEEAASKGGQILRTVSLFAYAHCGAILRSLHGVHFATESTESILVPNVGYLEQTLRTAFFELRISRIPMLFHTQTVYAYQPRVDPHDIKGVSLTNPFSNTTQNLAV